MSWAPNVWNQLKNITKGELISALEKDGWVRDVKIGAEQVYYEPTTKKRVSVHYHPKETYRSAKLLNAVLKSIGWSEADMKRLKLIK